MGTRVILWIAIVTMLVSQTACLIHTKQRITTEEYVRNLNVADGEIDDPDKILMLELVTGELVVFDESGGRYLERSRLIMGTT